MVRPSISRRPVLLLLALCALLAAGLLWRMHAAAAETSVAWSQAAGQASVFPACASADPSGGACNANGTETYTVSWDETAPTGNDACASAPPVDQSAAIGGGGAVALSLSSTPFNSNSNVNVLLADGSGNVIASYAGLPCAGSQQVTFSPSAGASYTIYIQGAQDGFGYDSIQLTGLSCAAAAPAPAPAPSGASNPGSGASGPSGSINPVSPNPCIIAAGQTTCTVSTSYATNNASWAQLNLYPVGGRDVAQSNALSGTVSNTLGPGNYTYSLYGIGSDQTTKLLAQQTFTVAQSSSVDLTAGSVTPTAAIPGPVTFSATVSNGGSGSTGAGFSNFFQKASGSNGAGLITDLPPVSLGPLAGGSSATISTSLDVPPDFFVFSLRACADKSSRTDGGTIAETDETNNCGPWTDISNPVRFSVTPCTLPASGGSCNVTVDFKVLNATFTVDLVQTGAASASVTGLNPDPIVPMPIYAPGTYTFTLYKAGTTQIIARKTIQIFRTGSTDLTAQDIAYQGTVAAGKSVRITATIENGGGASTGQTLFPNLIEIYEGSQPPASFDQIQVTNVHELRNLLPLASDSWSYTFRVPDAGPFWARACADTDAQNNADIATGYGTIDETPPASNEANNCSPDWVELGTGLKACVPSSTCLDASTVQTTSADCSTKTTQCRYASAGYGCFVDSFGVADCAPVPAPALATFSVKPSLVHLNGTASITWAKTADSQPLTCTVTGTNGDRWSDDARDTAPVSHTTSPITSQTSYVIACRGAVDDAVLPSRSVTVTLIPVFQEQ